MCVAEVCTCVVNTRSPALKGSSPARNTFFFIPKSVLLQHNKRVHLLFVSWFRNLPRMNRHWGKMFMKKIFIKEFISISNTGHSKTTRSCWKPVKPFPGYVTLNGGNTKWVRHTMDNRARGSWIGNVRAVLFPMYGVSASPLKQGGLRAAPEVVHLFMSCPYYTNSKQRSLDNYKDTCVYT